MRFWTIRHWMPSVIATPDHWHAPMTIQSCQAGKDVYVEKPMTHNCLEGQLMVDASREHQRVVQVGTQNRSALYNQAARQYIADGKLGSIHLCRVYNQKARSDCIWSADSRVPEGLTGICGVVRRRSNLTTQLCTNDGTVSGAIQEAISLTTEFIKSISQGGCVESTCRNPRMQREDVLKSRTPLRLPILSWPRSSLMRC